MKATADWRVCIRVPRLSAHHKVATVPTLSASPASPRGQPWRSSNSCRGTGWTCGARAWECSVACTASTACDTFNEHDRVCSLEASHVGSFDANVGHFCPSSKFAPFCSRLVPFRPSLPSSVRFCPPPSSSYACATTQRLRRGCSTDGAGVLAQAQVGFACFWDGFGPYPKVVALSPTESILPGPVGLGPIFMPKGFDREWKGKIETYVSIPHA